MSLSHGLKWVGLGQLVKILSQLVALFYLTRLISPSDYGLLAMSSVVMNLANIFNDLGTGSAIVQRQDPTKEFYNYIYKINIYTGIAIMCMVILISPLIVSYFNRIELYGILLTLSLSFPISSLSIVHKAFLEKQMKFKEVIRVEIIASISSMILAIILANMNFGVYCLIFQTLSGVIVSTIMFFSISNLNLHFTGKFNFNKNDILGFSGNILGFNLINYFSRNLDSVLIGRFFSVAILGSYSIAYRIMLFPLQSLTFVVARVFLPHLSNNLQNVEKNKRDYFRGLQAILSLSAPLMLGLGALSHEFVAIFFDKKWFLVGDLLIWLAPTAIIQSALSTTGAVFIAYAKTFWLFVLGCIGALLIAIAFCIGILFNIKIFILCYFVANVINFFPVMYLLGKVLNFNFIELSKIIFKSIFPAILMYMLLKFNLLYFFVVSLKINFTINVALGVIYFILFYFIFNFKDSKNILSYFNSKFMRRKS